MTNRLTSIDTMPNLEVLNRYRLDKGGIRYLEQLLYNKIQPLARRNNSLSVRDKILVTLRYLATGPIQLNDADIHGVSQPTVSRVVTEVVSALSSPDIVGQFIKFPCTREELIKNQQEFYGIAKFPKVVGVIDGTHIRIQAPANNEELYVNRKGFHSLNVQLAFDPFDQIIDVVCKWPGSVHDSRILQQSGLTTVFEGGHMPVGQYHLLGDSGYPCKKWLLTPFINPQTSGEIGYNRSHKITRAKVERGIGQLKRRFGVLHREVSLKPEKVCKVVLACAVLHNICKRLNIQMPLQDDDDDDNDDNSNAQDNTINGNNAAFQNGLRFRDHIVQTYF
ncbi:putative nuclease HARBI1 [Ruditapes philippinarum]|uniref:putative nuclease HARBI1 n=1 Tax=Ruditapes philippinarum TaxID=129788 RepID=UPI00295B1A4E|nr:putative nuclease HARBI1 [Ruditapes philippinarum]